MPEQADQWKTALAARYRLDRLIGEGSAARVFAARDLKHDRDVAVKILRPELAGEVLSPRFQREISIAARLTHPHILPLFDSGDVAGVPYFVMPLAGGETLRTRLDREGAMPVDVVLGFVRQVAAALDYAHAQGVVHRDVKPENILLVGREALVADFGLAVGLHSRDARDRITGAGVVVGTPNYMSPEQAAGDPALDGRTDVYALGAVAFEMLTGRPPYEARSVSAVIVKHQFSAPPSPRAVRRAVPVAVDRAIRAAMAKDVATRLPSARAFIEALATPLPRRDVPGARPTWRQLVRIVGVAAVLLGLAAYWVARAPGAWRRRAADAVRPEAPPGKQP